MKTSKLPPHINCEDPEINHCDFYMLRDCPETCAYARDIKGKENCEHQSYCVLITVYQKPFCTKHYAKQCHAKKVYDKSLEEQSLKKTNDLLEGLLENGE